MAEQRPMRTPKPAGAAQARATRGAGGGAEKEQFDVEQLFDEIEEKARTWLTSFSNWVNQGDELLTRGREWIEAHPVALGIAKKYGRGLTFMPTSLEDARQSAKLAGSRLKGTASRSMQGARENPMDVAIVAGALGIAAWALLRNRA